MTTQVDVRVFAWLTGQDFNIGDSILRRPYLRALSRIGRVDLWVNDVGSDYVGGLAVPPGSRLSRSFIRWYLTILASLTRRRTVIAINAGEFRPSRSRAGLLCLLVLAGIIARARGGGLIWFGGSVLPTKSRRLRIMYVAAARCSRDVFWRDARSVGFGDRHDLMPDWAFAEGSPVTGWGAEPRRLAAFSLRGDRVMPDDAWFAWARLLITSLALEPIFIVQVVTDRDRAQEMAARLGGSVLDWEPGCSHLSQEARVRAVYRRSRIVVGDRLHALILAATEGAVPLGWAPSSTGKSQGHFDAVGLTFVGRCEGLEPTDLPQVSPETVDAWAVQLRGRVQDARNDLAAVTERMDLLRHE